MGGEIGAGATLAGTLLGRELTVMGWIANGFGVCVLLLIVLFVASLWHENRKPVTHLVLGALPGDDNDPRASLATIAAVCPCCNAWSNDCICTADCGASRCQMAEIDLPDWLPGDHRG